MLIEFEIGYKLEPIKRHRTLCRFNNLTYIASYSKIQKYNIENCRGPMRAGSNDVTYEDDSIRAVRHTLRCLGIVLYEGGRSSKLINFGCSGSQTVPYNCRY